MGWLCFFLFCFYDADWSDKADKTDWRMNSRHSNKSRENDWTFPSIPPSVTVPVQLRAGGKDTFTAATREDHDHDAEAYWSQLEHYKASRRFSFREQDTPLRLPRLSWWSIFHSKNNRGTRPPVYFLHRRHFTLHQSPGGGVRGRGWGHAHTDPLPPSTCSANLCCFIQHKTFFFSHIPELCRRICLFLYTTAVLWQWFTKSNSVIIVKLHLWHSLMTNTNILRFLHPDKHIRLFFFFLLKTMKNHSLNAAIDPSGCTNCTRMIVSNELWVTWANVLCIFIAFLPYFRLNQNKGGGGKHEDITINRKIQFAT